MKEMKEDAKEETVHGIVLPKVKGTGICEGPCSDNIPGRRRWPGKGGVGRAEAGERGKGPSRASVGFEGGFRKVPPGRY